MRTTKPTLDLEAAVTGLREKARDPEDLWLDQEVPPEDLIRLDPLDISQEMVEQAERPEEADPVLRSLPERKFSLRSEALWRMRMRAELRKRNAEREALARREAARDSK